MPFRRISRAREDEAPEEPAGEEFDEFEEWDEDDLEDWDEDEEPWEDDDEEAVDWSDAWDEDGDGEVSAGEFSRTVSFGVLCMLPLLVGYEWARSVDPATLAGVAGEGGGTRSIAEAILSAPLAPLGDQVATWVRRAVLAALAVFGLIGSWQRGGAVVPRAVRVVAEGALGAVLLGPLLAAASKAAEPLVGAMFIGEVGGGVPELRRAAFVMGGAAFEELVFRVLAVALLFLVFRQGAIWLGFGRRFATLVGGVQAAVGASLLFALFHTQAATGWLGPGGEPFEPALFTWRAASGLALTAIVFWRGVGVSAWAHAFFNLALLLGVRPPALF
ncbi:MAG: CPBP family glutamic-type intramembrane protease [Planctomycetota bacterium]